MNILILCDLQPMGGTVTYMGDFVLALQKLGHSVTIVSFAEEAYDFFPHHPLITRIPFLIKNRYYKISFFSRFFKLFSFLKTKNPTQFDLVFSDYYLPAVSYFLSRFLMPKWKKIPMFYQFHGSIMLEHNAQELYNKRRLRRINYAINYVLERLCFAQAKKIICLSNYSRSILEQTFHCQDKVVLIRPGREQLFDVIRKKYTRHQAREELGLSPTKKILFLASRVDPRKGIVECFHLLMEQKIPDILIILATNLNDFTGELTEASNLPLMYFHLPPREQIGLLYRAADVTLLPSRALETFGLTTLESLSLGTPVVAYDIGANAELLPTELLASISHPQSFVDVLKNVLNKDKSAKEKLSESCVEKAYKYSWKSYAQEVISLVRTSV